MRTRVRTNGRKSFKERLKFLITRSSKEQFSTKTGISHRRIDQLLEGQEPVIGELTQILGGFPEVIEKWLLTGEGVPVRDSSELLARLSDYSDICERFRRERLDHDYTQEEWGKIFNRARPTIAAIETNRQAIPFDVVRIWHKKFGRSYSYIIDGVEGNDNVPALLAKIEQLAQDKKFLQDLLSKLS